MPRKLQILGTFPNGGEGSTSSGTTFDPEYSGCLVYISENGSLTPLQLGLGLKIENSTIVLNISKSNAESITASVDPDGVFRVYNRGSEVIPEVDESGAISWPGVTVSVDSNGTMMFGV